MEESYAKTSSHVQDSRRTILDVWTNLVGGAYQNK